MTITSVSNENGAAGTTITVNGTNFVGVSQVIFPGDIQGTNLQPVSVTQLKITVPPGITSTDYLTVKGVLGTAVSPQLFDSHMPVLHQATCPLFEQQWASDNIICRLTGDMQIRQLLPLLSGYRASAVLLRSQCQQTQGLLRGQLVCYN
jgi:hypothetical protein